MKDYLGFENERNKRDADLFVRIVQEAFGKDCDVLIGHHVTFEKHGDIKSENEIPSADTLLFDHDVMTKLFGEQALNVMASLAKVPAEVRDLQMREWLRRRDEEWTHRPPFPAAIIEPAGGYAP